MVECAASIAAMFWEVAMPRTQIIVVVTLLVLMVFIATVVLSRYYLTSAPQQRIYEQP
jgi:hypothetical protein